MPKGYAEWFFLVGLWSGYGMVVGRPGMGQNHSVKYYFSGSYYKVLATYNAGKTLLRKMVYQNGSPRAPASKRVVMKKL